MSENHKHGINTRILHDDAHIKPTKGTVNPPVHHASTILFDTVEELENCGSRPLDPGFSSYGIHGTTIQFALAQAITQMENGFDTIVTSSGLMAISLTLNAVLKSGDHLLMTDSVYGPTRAFCDQVLKKQNIEVSYYSPRIGADIDTLFQANTRLIFLESPGSYTFEIQDTPAIVAAAKNKGIITAIDNTWATPYFHQPLALGVDISIHAATKYFSGHSDVMLGSITSNAQTYPLIHQYAKLIGNHAAPDDCYLVLRGIRSLQQRLKQHEKNALLVADWLQSRGEVKYILHPARSDHPDHALWQRDFSGSSGLFGFVLHPISKQALANMLDNMELFGMGFSWGGFESLLLPGYLSKIRSAQPWLEEGTLLRIHIGLEDVEDLVTDLADGFDRLKSVE